MLKYKLYNVKATRCTTLAGNEWQLFGLRFWLIRKCQLLGTEFKTGLHISDGTSSNLLSVFVSSFYFKSLSQFYSFLLFSKFMEEKKEADRERQKKTYKKGRSCHWKGFNLRQKTERNREWRSIVCSAPMVYQTKGRWGDRTSEGIINQYKSLAGIKSQPLDFDIFF